MDAVKNTIRDILIWILNALYPGAEFDTAGLAGLLTSCLIVMAAAVLVYLLLKCFPDIRQFAHVAAALALTALIAASAFFPKALVQAGDYAAEWLENHYWAMEEEPFGKGKTQEGETPGTEPMDRKPLIYMIHTPDKL